VPEVSFARYKLTESPVVSIVVLHEISPDCYCFVRSFSPIRLIVCAGWRVERTRSPAVVVLCSAETNRIRAPVTTTFLHELSLDCHHFFRSFPPIHTGNGKVSAPSGGAESKRNCRGGRSRLLSCAAHHKEAPRQSNKNEPYLSTLLAKYIYAN